MDGSDQLPFVGDDATAPARADQPAVPASAAPSADPSNESDVEGQGEVWGDPSRPKREIARTPAPARSFQAAAGIQGRQFAEQCDTLLTHLGYELRGRRVLSQVGVEIDQEAASPNGNLIWFEYKGSVQGHRPGLRRTDTLKKAIANGALLRALADPAPYVVITSHLPVAGSGAAMLESGLSLCYFTDVICLYDTTATARLSRL